MAAPNIVAVSSIIGKTAHVPTVATGSGSTVIASVTANHVYKLNSVTAANKSGASALISAYITRSSVNTHIVNSIVVPASASLVLVNKDSGLYLEESDVLMAIASTSGSISLLASYEDIS